MNQYNQFSMNDLQGVWIFLESQNNYNFNFEAMDSLDKVMQYQQF